MQDLPYSPIKQAILVACRLLATATITALIGAVLNEFYRVFFDPELYNSGPRLSGAIFFCVLTIPFILTGLILLGLPTSYLLKRLKLENWLSYAFVGATLGVGFLYALLSYLTPFGIGSAAVYGCLCATVWFAFRRKF